MNEAEKKKHRRLLYLGFALTVPLAVNEAACLLYGIFEIVAFNYVCTFGVDFYLMNGPLMLLIFNSQLRKDVLAEIRCKSSHQNIIQVAPAGTGSSNHQRLNVHPSGMDTRV